MPDLLTNLGLRTATTLADKAAIPNYAPHFLIANFVLSYAVLSARGAKYRLGIDNNVAPRDDIQKASAAVKAGKISQEALDSVKRREAAHANAVENYALLVAACVLALQAKLPNLVVNRHVLVYTLVRIAYAVAYAQLTDTTASYFRSALWWVANGACIRLIWFAGKAYNEGLV